MRTLVRYGAYPILAGGTLLVLIALAGRGVAYWPTFPLVVATVIAAVAGLERLYPYAPEWNLDHHGDTRTDVIHLLVSHALIQSGVAIGFGARQWLGGHTTPWPQHAPMALQVLLAGLILDLGLYLMHRASHASGFLWRLHAVHHSSERLYWLNGGRRHPLSALVLASPGLVTLFLLGATPIAVGTWLAFMSVHLAFQHANLDYRLGFLRRYLSVAEMHRWHHKREYEDAQVNYGEVLLVWDRLFGTFHEARRDIGQDEVGLPDNPVPHAYRRQLTWPFTRP